MAGPGKPDHLTNHCFSGPKHIHYDQYDSTDGTTWRKTAEGEKSRDNP